MKYSIIVILCLVFQNIGFSQSANHRWRGQVWLYKGWAIEKHHAKIGGGILYSKLYF